MFFPSLKKYTLDFQLGRLFFVNGSCYLLLGVIFFLSEYLPLFVVTHVKSLLLLIVVLPLTGLNIAALLEVFFRQKFTLLEKLFLATLVALVIPALFLSIFYSLFSLYNEWYIFLLALSAFLLAFIANPQFLSTHSPDPLPSSLKWTFALATLIYTLIVGRIVTSYYALPDLDPYYWLKLYQDDALNQALTPLDGYRPLFSSFSSLFYGTAAIDFFAYFKYVLPFLLLSLLLPLALVAKRFESPVKQMLVFGFPFITSSFLLYTLTPIPQSLLNISLILFCVSLLHSYLERNPFFFFISGVFLLGTALFHEAASIIVFFWVLVGIFFFRDNLKQAYRNNPVLVGALLVLLSLQFFKVFHNVADFLLVWGKKFLNLILQSSPNFHYPATYINIDGNAVGWGTPLGVIKYYGFYSGPVMLLLILTSVFLFWQRKVLIKNFKEVWVLGVSGVFFFVTAEILPRFFNIAILPERAWGLVVLFSYSIFLVILLQNKYLTGYRYHKLFLGGFLIAFALNIGGALYVNELKQHLITRAQLTSTEWIKGSLPEEKIFFTYGHESLLRTHGQSATLASPDPNLYTDIRVFNALLKKHRLNSLDLESNYFQYIKNLERASERLKTYELSLEKDPILFDTLALKQSTEEFLEYIRSEKEVKYSQQNIYIYFAKPSALNPYAKRPYNENSPSLDFSEFVFDKEKEHFKRVYTLPNDEIVIWQYLP